MHELWRINISSVDWLNFLFLMSSRIVLCDNWSFRCYGLLLLGNVCNLRVSRLLVLCSRHVLWIYCLELHQLRLRHLPSVHWFELVFCLSCRFILFNIGPLDDYW